MHKLQPLKGANQAEVLISRFEPALKHVLEDHIKGNLDPIAFPYARPDQAPLQSELLVNQSSASLRSAKPTWAFAASSTSLARPRERVIVFMAGGATYSEARVCYEIGNRNNRDVVLMTTHMLTPRSFLGQLSDLSTDRRRLNLPADRQARRAPNHLFEEPAPKTAPQPSTSQRPPQQPPRPSGGSVPTDRMGALDLNGGRYGESFGKLRKDKEGEKKKKHGFFR
jgi:syntaxin-binding protein 1